MAVFSQNRWLNGVAHVKKSGNLNAVVAIIGCLSGVTSLGWQIWSEVKPVPERLTIDADFLPNEQNDTLTIHAIVTNIGQRNVHVRDTYLLHPNSTSPLVPTPQLLVPIGTTNDAALEPGAYRVYSSQPITFDAVEKWRDLSQRPELRVKTTTSFEHEFRSRDLSATLSFHADVFLDKSLH